MCRNMFCITEKTVLFFFTIIEVLRSFEPDYLPAMRKKSKQMTQNICLDNCYVGSLKRTRFSPNILSLIESSRKTLAINWVFMSSQHYIMRHIQSHVKMIGHDCSKQGPRSLICSNLGSVSRVPVYSHGES